MQHSERPQARATPHLPQRPDRPRLAGNLARSSLDVQTRIRELEADFLWKMCGPDGRRKLLQAHGLMPR